MFIGVMYVGFKGKKKSAPQFSRLLANLAPRIGDFLL